MHRGFPPPWTAERISGGFVVKDATGQALAYVYARETKAQADTAKVLTMVESAPDRGEYRKAAGAAKVDIMTDRFKRS